MANEAWTIKRVLDFATDFFTKANIPSPRLESEILLAYALKIKRIDLYIKFDTIVTPQELALFKGFILRRKAHEPTAYITGKKAFMSLDFTVTKDTLIPRPETEMLVESAIDIGKEKQNVMILDIGTGSGAIAISLAKYLPNSYVVATDISEKALEVAKINAVNLGVSNRTVFVNEDLYPKTTDKYDIIISNPPYIKTDAINDLAPEVKDHEPTSSLDGGPDGMKYYSNIINSAKKMLNENGYLLLEIAPYLKSNIITLSNDIGFKNVSIKNDLQNLERIAVIH